MNLRHLLILLAFGVTGSAFGQEAQPATVYKLRNIAAADAAKAVTVYAGQKKLTVTVVAEPVTNAVFVAGDAAQQKQVVELCVALDKQLPTVQMSMLVLEVPADFAKDVGLGEGDQWVLTPREVTMLSLAIRREKQTGGIDVLSRPQLTLTDNQTGFFEVLTGPQSFVIRATPRISPKGDSISMRVETQSTKLGTITVIRDENTSKPMPLRAMDTQALETTESVPVGSTLVIRCARWKSDKETRDVVIIITPTVVPIAK